MEEVQEDGSGVVDNSTETQPATDNQTIATQPIVEKSFIPEEYRNDTSFKDYKNLNDIFKTYKEQEKANSKAVAFVPDEKAPKEQWDKFYNKIGRPEAPDKYSLPEKQLPEGYQRNEEYIKNVQQMAHSVGLRPEQFNILFNILEEAGIEQHNKQLELDKDFDSKLDKFFGEKKDEHLTNAINIASKYLPEELKSVLEKNDNIGLTALAVVLKGIHEDYIKSDTITDINKGGLSMDDKKAEYFKIREDISKLDQFSSEYQRLASRKIQLAGEMGKPIISLFDKK